MLGIDQSSSAYLKKIHRFYNVTSEIQFFKDIIVGDI